MATRREANKFIIYILIFVVAYCEALMFYFWSLQSQGFSDKGILECYMAQVGFGVCGMAVGAYTICRFFDTIVEVEDE